MKSSQAWQEDEYRKIMTERWLRSDPLKIYLHQNAQSQTQRFQNYSIDASGFSNCDPRINFAARSDDTKSLTTSSPLKSSMRRRKTQAKNDQFVDASPTIGAACWNKGKPPACGDRCLRLECVGAHNIGWGVQRARYIWWSGKVHGCYEPRSRIWCWAARGTSATYFTYIVYILEFISWILCCVSAILYDDSSSSWPSRGLSGFRIKTFVYCTAHLRRSMHIARELWGELFYYTSTLHTLLTSR